MLINWLDSLSFNNFETKYQHTSIQAKPISLTNLLVKTLVIFGHKDFVYLMGQLSKLDKEHLGDRYLVKKDLKIYASRAARLKPNMAT